MTATTEAMTGSEYHRPVPIEHTLMVECSCGWEGKTRHKWAAWRKHALANGVGISEAFEMQETV